MIYEAATAPSAKELREIERHFAVIAIDDSNRALRTLRVFMGLGTVGIVIYAAGMLELNSALLVAGIGGIAAGGCVLTGGLLGFLFGIPRLLQQDDGVRADLLRLQLNGDTDRRPLEPKYQVNTNLEQISDWLTKILVGVGLTQIEGILQMMQDAIHLIGNSISAESGESFALVVLLYFLPCGFLFGYLWTRLSLANALRQADLQVVGAFSELETEVRNAIAKAEEASKTVDDRDNQNTKAIELVDQQLNEGTPQVDIKTLTEATEGADKFVRLQIYRQARAVRRSTWKSDKGKMALTIPIFRALLESGQDDSFFDLHAQLGYALKDQSEPNWQRAESELTQAIDIRDAQQRSGWQIYELNRAICKINQDKAFREQAASSGETKKDVLADLRVAVTQKWIKKLVVDDPTIQEWLGRNSVSTDDLDTQGAMNPID